MDSGYAHQAGLLLTCRLPLERDGYLVAVRQVSDTARIGQHDLSDCSSLYQVKGSFITERCVVRRSCIVLFAGLGESSPNNAGHVVVPSLRRVVHVLLNHGGDLAIRAVTRA